MSTYIHINANGGSNDTDYNGHVTIGAGISFTLGGDTDISQSLLVGYGSSATPTTLAINGSSTLVSVGAGYNAGLTDPYVDYDGSSAPSYVPVTVGDGAGTVATLLLSGGATLQLLDANAQKGKVYLAYGTGSTGTLRITDGMLDAQAVHFGAGTGTLEFAHAASNYLFAAGLEGTGTVTQASGTTTLQGDGSAFDGAVNVTGGVLKVGGSLGNATVTVASGATLGGGGTIGGTVSIADGGILTQQQGSTLAMGSLVLSTTSAIQATLGADTDTTPLFSVGDLTLDGELTVASSGAFAFGEYVLFSYTGTLDNQGLVINALPAGFNPADWNIEVAGGQVLLSVQAGAALQYWDGAALSVGVEGGSGTWNGTLTNWTNADGDLNAAWADHGASFGGTAGTVTVEGSRAFTSLAFAIGGYSLAAGSGAALAISNGGTDGSVTVAAGTAQVDVPVTGSAGLVKLGTGTLQLGGASTYTGATTVQAGTLALSASGSIAGSSGLDVATGATFSIAGIGGTFATIGSLAGSGTVALGGKMLVAASAASTGFSGTFSGGGTLQKAGGGTLTLSATSSDLATLDVAAGSVAVTATTALADTTTASVASGAVLALAASETLGGLSGNAGASLTIASAKVLTVAAAGSTTYGGNLSGAGSLVKTGAGTLTLEGAATQAGTTVTAGTLAVDGGGSITHAASNLTVGGTNGSTGVLDIADGSVRAKAAFVGNVAGAAGQVLVGASGSWTIDNEARVGVGGSGTLAVEGGGTVAASTLVLGYSSGSSGTATVSGEGSSVTSQGAITIGRSGSGTLTISDGASVQADAGGLSFTFSAIVGMSSAVNIGAAAGDTAAAAGMLDAFSLALDGDDSVLVFNHTDAALDFGAELEISTNGAVHAYAGTTRMTALISGGSDAAVHVHGGSLELAADNSMFSGTTHLAGGTLVLSNTYGLGASNAAVVVEGAAALQVGAGLSVAQAVTVGAALGVQVASGTATLAGAIGGSSLLSKTGSGTLVLSATNGTSGGFAIDGGTLQLASAAAAGSGSIAFGTAATLRLQAFTLANALTGFGTDDTIDLQGITYADAAVSLGYTGGVLTVTQAATTLTLQVAGVGAGYGFKAVADGDGSTLLRLAERPSDIVEDGGALAVDEASAAGTAVGKVLAVDGDSNVFTYALTDSAGGRFAIDASTGAVTVAARLLLDYEQATQHQLTVQATDDTGFSVSRTFTVQVGNVTPETVAGSADKDTIVGGSGADALTGLDMSDSLTGGGGADTLDGGDGNDRLAGGSGADSMVGGAGNDQYEVDDALDQVVEASGAGTDTVRSTATWTLAADVERLVLVGAGAIDGTGNGEANILTGNLAANTLAGQGGNDRLLGLAGNDSLAGGDDADRLEGGIGDDTLQGDGGNDVLLGGVGDDSMVGGAGNDTYVVDEAGDSVTELDLGGNDLVRASLTVVLADHVERLVLTGIGAIGGTGNGGNNTLAGNIAANDLDGGAGNDRVRGGGGNDSLTGGEGTDVLSGDLGADTVEGDAGDDRVQGNLGNDSLAGGIGRDLLEGGDGADTLAGGAGGDKLLGGTGADLFVFEAVGDSLAGERDKVLDFSAADGDLLQLSAIHDVTAVVGAFTGVAGQVLQKAAAGGFLLQFDADGNGAADMVIEVVGATPLVLADFATAG